MMNLKKSALLFTAAATLSLGAPALASAYMVPTTSSLMLNNQYPAVGVDGSTVYYMDPSSCYLNVYGDKAEGGCTIYYTASGNTVSGSLANIQQANVTYVFVHNNTYQKVLVKSVITSTGQDVTQEFLKQDKGFLYTLFDKIVAQTGKAQTLDYSFNKK
ncbi:MAG: hypothetical protein SOY70_00445 [Veillonellaceae bacterium]|nr:hypothetical protein [Veillonellaceae bacterium]